MSDQLFPARVGEIALVRLELFPDCEFWAQTADDPADTLIALKPICEAMGLDWEGQRQRIQRDSVLGPTAFVIKAVAEDGRAREMLSLPLAYINGWLFGVDETRVRVELQERVHVYRRECFNALWRHFSGQKELTPPNPFQGVGKYLAEEMREALAPLASAVCVIAGDVTVMKRDMATVKTEIVFLRNSLPKGRKDLLKGTKEEHIRASHELGGRCPCCGVNAVTNPDGTQAPNTHFDHFYACDMRGPDQTWLICKPCHNGLTFGKILRHNKEAAFAAYQDRRKNRPGTNMMLAIA